MGCFKETNYLAIISDTDGETGCDSAFGCGITYRPILAANHEHAIKELKKILKKEYANVDTLIQVFLFQSTYIPVDFSEFKNVSSK